jgi:hypothetical protein
MSRAAESHLKSPDIMSSSKSALHNRLVKIVPINSYVQYGIIAVCGCIRELAVEYRLTSEDRYQYSSESSPLRSRNHRQIYKHGQLLEKWHEWCASCFQMWSQSSQRLTPTAGICGSTERCLPVLVLQQHMNQPAGKTVCSRANGPGALLLNCTRSHMETVTSANPFANNTTKVESGGKPPSGRISVSAARKHKFGCCAPNARVQA